MGKAKLEIKKYKFDYISLILNIIIFGILLYETFKVVPSSEGWFIELTKDKSLLEILNNDEILLPPIYPIFIWLVNIFNNQLLFLRIFGIFFGYILYSQSSLLIQNGTLIFIDTKKKFAKILSNIISIFLIIFVCNISNYLLWYDFTILVLIFQISIVNLIFNLINRNNFYDSKFNYYQAISFLTITGVLLKHSNMAIYFFSVQIALFIIWLFYKKERIWINKLFSWQILFMVIFSICGLVVFYLSNTSHLDSFLSASLEAKGGGENVSKFVSFGIDHLINELRKIDTFFLGLTLFFYFISNKNLKLFFLIIFSSIFYKTTSYQDYNLAGYSNKFILIIFFVCLAFLIKSIILKLFYLEEEIHQYKNSQKLLILLFASIGCFLGNFTSAGLGYNGYFIGLLIGIIFQASFFIQVTEYLLDFKKQIN
jgi:hypothetical protein